MVLSASAWADETETFTAFKTCYVPVVTIAVPAPGGYCLITGSSLEILEGAKAYYTDAHVVLGVLSSPVTIRANDEDGSTATGFCTSPLQTPPNRERAALTAAAPLSFRPSLSTVQTVRSTSASLSPNRSASRGSWLGRADTRPA